jgi:hypothetical protein
MIVVIPCGKAKRDTPCAAGVMYTGGYHRACMAYARSIAPPENVYILSAKYGLLALADTIAPYELTLGQPGAVTATTVREQAAARGLLDADAVAVAGSRYAALCRDVWPACRTPLAGVGGLGYQQRWLAQHRGVAA